ncbi:MAG: PIN domain-containing protein [Gammaproteobacteria bacterium]|nr:PIN domain-containing protein [Gammaproteobacteria bacterium]
MCAILDNDVVHQVFGTNRSQAGSEFFRWIDAGRIQLVIGGKLRRELGSNQAFKAWLQQKLNAGQATDIDDLVVDSVAAALAESGSCRSNDTHVVALAQISNARLLYSNDTALHEDFKNKRLIDNPRGRVYSTLAGGELRDSHRRLLRNNRCSQGHAGSG